MTKREREQVVELLRCAADGLSPTSTGAWTDALNGLDAPVEIELLAADAFRSISSAAQFTKAQCEEGRAVYLEAAARVEEGSWP